MGAPVRILCLRVNNYWVPGLDMDAKGKREALATGHSKRVHVTNN